MRDERPPSPATVAIVEDEREVREGLRYLLGLDDRLCIRATFGDAEEFLSWLAANPEPDLVLMDINLPGMSGIEATRLVRERFPSVIVLILTIFEDEDKILASIRAGARGYILKNTKPEALIEQILSARDEGSPISPTVARRLLDELRRSGGDRTAVDYNLTPREQEVLKDIVDGLTYRELAERHHIAGSTAKKHILHIYQKLNVSSKAEIVRKAIKEGLI
ncbi:MAG: response regulator transcription factor [Spirochaetes bacterium]|nr:response regulator transcription factor [Spirochaetota bacterium]